MVAESPVPAHPCIDSSPPQRCPVCTQYPRRPSRKYRPPVIVTYLVLRQGWVKIGSTGDLKSRLKALRLTPAATLCPPGMDYEAPLRLLLALPLDVEHALHVRLSEHHVCGEWFAAAPVIAALHLDVVWDEVLS